ncbi:MAG: hypothetical protein R6U31_06075, partial [bacterium]
EQLPDEERRGNWLEEISEQVREFLPDDCLFVRYDLCWESPWAREDDFFDAGGRWLGPPNAHIQELRDTCGTVRGFGTCVFRKVFINGSVKTIGYLHNLRLEKDYRDGYSLALGYKKFRETSDSHDAFCYLTSILKSNKAARRILTSLKGGLPSYIPLTDYRTFIIKSGVKKSKPGQYIKKYEDNYRDRLYEFITEYGSEHNFFPYLTKEELFDSARMEISRENLYFIERDNRIRALASLWDISRIKQLYIASYSPMVKFIRPFHNLLSSLRKTPALPPVNKQLSYSYIFPLIIGNACKEDTPNLIDALSELSCKKGNEFFITGCTPDTPLESLLNTYPHIRMDSTIYAVDWHNELQISNLKSNPLHIEVGRL